ncbi:MAG: hypothetical protein ACLUR5_02415 [Eubacterium ventriosum]
MTRSDRSSSAGCYISLLETTINGAENAIINITGDVSLFEANEATKLCTGTCR